jgi:hypothetical protein
MAKKPSRQRNNGDDTDLRNEVAAFASQLGLGAAGGGAGFDDADFAPSKAGLRLGKETEQNTTVPPSKTKPRNKFKPDAEKEEASPWKREVDPELAAAIAERNWNAGVGERPGASCRKSSKYS